MNDTRMLEETGKVVAVEGRYAVIETERRSSCNSCHAGGSCGVSLLGSLFKTRPNRIRLVNHLDLSVGDLAVIGINESVLLSTAVMAYMLPLILMIVLAVISNLFGFGDDISFAASMLGLFSGMKITNIIMGNRDYQEREIVLLRNASELPVKFMDKQSI